MPRTTYTIDDLSFNRFLGYSAWFHLSLTAFLLVGVWVQRSGNAWGGIGGGGDSGVRVSLVRSAGIPMPQPTITSPESSAVDPTKGLNKDEPKPKPEPKTDAINIHKFEKEKPQPASRPSKVFESKTPPPENAVPYGKGGQTNLPSGFSDFPGPANGGVAVQGQGGGDFASRYGWYIEAVKRAVNQNWMQNTIDPSTRAARRAKTVVTFTINRDGSIKNIHVSESSCNRSMDDSAQRALLSIDHFPHLPSDYSGRYVDVIFDFDLGLSK
jgi:periplasmic protein TonB